MNEPSYPRFNPEFVGTVAIAAKLHSVVIVHVIVSAIVASIIFLHLTNMHSHQHRRIVAHWQEENVPEIVKSYVRTQPHIRVDVCARANGASASRLVLVQVVDGADGVVLAADRRNQVIVVARFPARSVHVQIDLIIDVPLNEIGYLRVRDYATPECICPRLSDWFVMRNAGTSVK